MGVQSGQSFQERKAAQLASERSPEPEGNPAPAEAPENIGLPSEELESVGEQDLSQGLTDDEYDDQDELEGSDGALSDEEEIPPTEDQDEADEPNVDWEKRYQDLRSETQTLMESKKGMDREQAEAMAEHARYRFELEDTLSEAQQRADFFRQMMGSNAAKYRQINWAQVAPDQLSTLQQEAQQAFMLEQQANTAYEQFAQHQDQMSAASKQREAEIARIRLRRTIPNWDNKVYAEVRDFAVQEGMDVRQFNEITDPVVIEWAYNAMQSKNAGSQVQKSVRRKQKAPRGRNVRRQPRDERGQFQTKQVVPNQRGSFADRHKHRLAAERRGN